MKEKVNVSAAADALNETSVKEVPSRNLGARTRKTVDPMETRPDDFVKMGEYIGKPHNYGSSITVKPSREKLLEITDDSKDYMTLSCNAVNFLSLTYDKEEILDLILNITSEVTEIVKDVILKDDSILVLLDKSAILKDRDDADLLDYSLNYIERYINLEAIPNELLDLTVMRNLKSYGEEFAIEVDYNKLIADIIAPRLIRINYDLTRTAEEEKRIILSRWEIGKHEVRKDELSTCFVIAPSDADVVFKKKNFVALQATLTHSEYAREFKHNFNKDSAAKVEFKKISSVLNNMSKSSVTSQYILKGSDSSAEVTNVPLVEFNRSKFELESDENSNNWFLRSLAKACNTSKNLNETSLRRYFGELINESVIIFGVEGETRTFLLPDIYKITHYTLLGRVDATLKTAIKVNDTHVSVNLHI